MNILRRATILSLLAVILAASPSFAATSSGPCWKRFSALVRRTVDRVVVRSTDRVQICGYQEGVCYENAALVAKALKDKGVAPGEIRVLYVSNLAYYNVHAIVVHNGKVFDALKFRNAGGAMEVRGQAIAEYFATTNSGPGAIVLDIDSQQYLQTLPENLSGQFGDQLFGRAPTHPANQRLPLSEYLRRTRILNEASQ